MALQESSSLPPQQAISGPGSGSAAARRHPRRPIVVLKFGSSVLDRKTGLARVVHEIYREVRRGTSVLAVVSAFPGVTDGLLRQARRHFDAAEPSFLAGLLTAGEAASAAFLGMALDQAGVPATVVDPARVGLEARGPALDADPVDLDTEAIQKMFERLPVVVMPGFIGRGPSGAPVLLGRGGSDLTALFAAHRLGARQCRLVKDVDGLFDSDPRGGARPGPRRYASTSWEEALAAGGRAIQPKALRFARDTDLSFNVAGLGSSCGTIIGPGPARLESPREPRPLLRVSLLGLGTVGLGVYRWLALYPDRFEIVAAAVRHPEKDRSFRVPPHLLSEDPGRVLEGAADVVVELVGGEEPARAWIEASLDSGRNVVTANKDVIARSGPRLQNKAERAGVRLAYSASVGGAVPILEQVEEIRRHRAIERIEGVVNGTCNYILDRLAEGIEMPAAVRLAVEKGFAEADPAKDIDGTDSACKLAILTQAAFGVSLPLGEVRFRGIAVMSPALVREARSRGEVIRLVASSFQDSRGVHAEVRPVFLPKGHFLAGARNEENRISIEPRGGEPVRLSGKGAGRWPTSLAVLADLLDLHQERSAPPRDNRVPVLAEVRE